MDAENLFLTCYMNYLCGNNQDIYVDASSMTDKLNGLNSECWDIFRRLDSLYN